MASQISVLLAMCEEANLEAVAYFLRHEGFKVSTLLTSGNILEVWEKEQHDVLILDEHFENHSGINICRDFRLLHDAPVVMLYGRWNENVVVSGYKAKADSYLIKPFSFRELKESLMTLYWRATKTEVNLAGSHVKVGDLYIDSHSFTATVAGKRVPLTKLEFLLTLILASNVGQVVKNERLIEFVWGDEDGDTNLIKTHLSHIRTKLLAAGETSIKIRSMPGVGYSLESTPTAAE